MTDLIIPSGPEAAVGVAAFQLVQSLMKRLAESGTVPEAVVFGAIREAVAVLESAGDQGEMIPTNEAAAAIIRAGFPKALAAKS